MLYLPYWMAYEKHELVNALGFEEALKKTNKLDMNLGEGFKCRVKLFT